MRYSLWIVCLIIIPFKAFNQSGGAVIKAGLIWNDYLRDDQSIFERSQAGNLLGLEIRLGAEDNTYFKLGAYYARLHFQSQSHPEETRFFKVRNGFEMLKATGGIETRILSRRHFNWRLSAAGAFTFIAGAMGNIRYEDFNNGQFGLHLATGFDLAVFSIDLGLEPGFSDFLNKTDNTRPVMMLLTMGFHF